MEYYTSLPQKDSQRKIMISYFTNHG